jgi:signal transduction histidine kinase
LLGLAGALRERAQIHTGFVLQIDAPNTLPPLPTAVETAAYYIALAALANVEKHAGAQACTVRLALTSGEDGEPAVLELDVTDDGRGLPAQTDLAGGLGLLSMQARAVEVGGVCRFTARPGGGTRVIVRLPCSVPVE